MAQTGSSPLRKSRAPPPIARSQTHLLNTIPSPKERLPAHQKVLWGSTIHGPQRAPDRPSDICIELFDGVRRVAAEEELVGEFWEHGDEGFHGYVVAVGRDILGNRMCYGSPVTS